MEKLNSVANNTYNVNTISEFYNLPKNTDITVNNVDCKLLWNNDVWFGVEIDGNIYDVERALSLYFRIYRRAVYVETIAEVKDIMNSIKPSDSSFTLIIENNNCLFNLEIYRTFSHYGHLNDIILSPVVGHLEISKDIEIEGYIENRDYYFDIFGDGMLPKRHLYFPELDLDDEQLLDHLFQDIADTFGRKYVFHEYGTPVKIFEPTKADK